MKKLINLLFTFAAIAVAATTLIASNNPQQIEAKTVATPNTNSEAGPVTFTGPLTPFSKKCFKFRYDFESDKFYMEPYYATGYRCTNVNKIGCVPKIPC